MALKTISTPGGGAHDDDDSGAEIMSEINITPLVDVFLVLLIIFMVTTSVMSQMGVNVNLPQASQQTSSSQPDGVIVTLLPGGALKLNGQALPSGDLVAFEAAIKKLFDQTTSRLVILEGDRQAFLGSAISVMDHAKKAGAQSFAIATSPEESK